MPLADRWVIVAARSVILLGPRRAAAQARLKVPTPRRSKDAGNPRTGRKGGAGAMTA